MSLARRFIFIHICKNAGTSIRRALRPYTIPKWQAVSNQIFKRVGIPQFRCPHNRDHATASQVIAEFGPEFFDSCFSFAIVRNPWDWEVSQYKYILKDTCHPRHLTVKRLNGFPDYVRWKSQTRFQLQQDYIDHDGIQVVNYVGRFENLDNDFQFISQQLGLQAKLARRNSTRPIPYPSFYDQKTIELIGNMYHADIKRFGYRFESPESVAAA